MRPDDRGRGHGVGCADDGQLDLELVVRCKEPSHVVGRDGGGQPLGNGADGPSSQRIGHHVWARASAVTTVRQDASTARSDRPVSDGVVEFSR